MREIAMSAALLIAVTGSADAQNQFNRRQTQTALETLNGAGAACEGIRRTATLGQMPSRDLIVSVECSNDGRYVVLVDSRGRMSFFATCEAFEEANRGSFCFR